MAEYYIGLMSGTSGDGIDAALVEFDAKTIHLRDHFFAPLPKTCRSALNPNHPSLAEIAAWDRAFGHAFAQASIALIDKTGLAASHITAIGSHGHTLYHQPESNTAYSWQLGDPNIIAAKTGITTVADFRRRDIAEGGQGAPLAPAFHRAYFGDNSHDLFIVNIGGLANITYLPADANKQTLGFDSGPGNTLLDGWVQKHRQQAFDKNGQWAQSGQVIEPLLQQLLSDPYFSAPAPKSTGKEYFNLNWLEHFLADQPYKNQDVQATLVALTAQSISASILSLPSSNEKRCVLCGGGAYNSLLIQQLSHDLPGIEVTTTSEYGIDPEWVEAVAFAWLAKQRLANQAISLEHITGSAKPSILGGIYAAGYAK